MTSNSHELKIDKHSFELGMINCFVEMVACGVKQLALSPPLTPEEFEVVAPASEEIVSRFGVYSFLEKSLLVTDLQTEEFTRGKWSILYYRDSETLDAYVALKERKQSLERTKRYDRQARRELSRDFMRLLSYPDEVIEEKLSLSKPTDPYVLADHEENC